MIVPTKSVFFLISNWWGGGGCGPAVPHLFSASLKLYTMYKQYTQASVSPGLAQQILVSARTPFWL
jgi:hypothetical protein